MTTSQYKKLTINLPQELWEELSERAGERSITVTELIRRAVALDGYLHEQCAGSDRILIERGDSLRELVFM